MVAIPINPSSILAETAATTFSVSSYFNDVIQVVELNQVLQRNATHSAQLLLMLPDPKASASNETHAAEYLSKLELLTNNLPSTMLVWNEDEAPVISTGI
ncbi:hypothetical protein BBJ28_00004638 [Nothophytophthora sp. Chile5]|nr:hypothetical protein BBJ28_00004638 [Nothophytophthora sp. Chile5]